MRRGRGNHMRRISLIALALVAGLALAARADDPPASGKMDDKTTKMDDKTAADAKDASQVHKGEAKRHIWTTDVAFEQAKIGLQGLYALADDNEGAFDK